MSISITHVGPTLSSFPTQNPTRSSSGRVLSLTASADGLRLYAGCYAGVWRSDDSGHSWRQLTRLQPASFDADVAGAIFAPHVFDLAVSPADPNLVLAGAIRGQFTTSRDGIYRTTDGGLTWTRVLAANGVSQIVFAPDDPALVYAAVGTGVAVSGDAGQTWSIKAVGGIAWHVAAAPLESSGKRRVYAAGDSNIWRSVDGGTTWLPDAGAAAIRSARAALTAFRLANGNPTSVSGFAGRAADAVGSDAQVLAIEPGNPHRLYLAAPDGTFGPSYFAKKSDGTIIPDGTLCNTTPDRFAMEGSIWFGDFEQFDTTGAAQWVQLPGPPVYTGGSTPSGNAFVVAKPTSAGFLLFFSDHSHVHVAAGKPTATASWHRLDGRDLSAAAQANDLRNRLFVHVDPHALIATSDLELTLKAPSGVDFPYDQNSVLDQHLAGTIWMANDGGVYWSNNGGQTWKKSSGLETLDPVNIAGLYGVGSRPALYIGTGDNDDFFTTDGGDTWGDPATTFGDADAWFSDVAQPTRVLEFAPRNNPKGVFLVTGGGYPNASNFANYHLVRAPRNSNMSSGFVLRGFRPVIRTLATELPPADGDYVFIGDRADGATVLFRTRSISTIQSEDDWEDGNKAQQVGAVLPPGAAGGKVVQVSGGHVDPVFYVSDGSARLWKWDENGGLWRALVPGGPPGRSADIARRFFADPFNANVIYIVDQDSVKLSLDGGDSWLADQPLTQAVTGGGKLSLQSSPLIRDMLFVRSEPFTRFVFGNAGVMYTTDGFQWIALLNSIALPGCPESGFFDAVSDPLDRTLYVILEGRSVLRLSGIPAPVMHEQPVFNMLELAAILVEA